MQLSSCYRPDHVAAVVTTCMSECSNQAAHHRPHKTVTAQDFAAVRDPLGALREACAHATQALPAQIAGLMALTAPFAVGFSGLPFHEPFHAEVLDHVERRVLAWSIGRRSVLV